MKLNSIKVFIYLYTIGPILFAIEILRWPIAQLVERGAVNSVVPGSSPGGPAKTGNELARGGVNHTVI